MHSLRGWLLKTNLNQWQCKWYNLAYIFRDIRDQLLIFLPPNITILNLVAMYVLWYLLQTKKISRPLSFSLLLKSVVSKIEVWAGQIFTTRGRISWVGVGVQQGYRCQSTKSKLTDLLTCGKVFVSGKPQCVIKQLSFAKAKLQYDPPAFPFFFF